MHWMSILGLSLIVLGTIFSFFGTYFSDRNSQQELTEKIQEKNKVIDDINRSNSTLIDQNTSLLASNNNVSTTNANLIMQNSEMLEKIGNYQTDIEERNKEIYRLQAEIANIKMYSYYAKLDIFGRDITPGVGINYTSDLSNRMAKLVTMQPDGKVYVINNLSHIKLAEDVIEKYPAYPFGYFALYQIQKAFNNAEWRKNAEKTKEIFEITTTIQGCHSSQIEALEIVIRDLSNNK